MVCAPCIMAPLLMASSSTVSKNSFVYMLLLTVVLCLGYIYYTKDTVCSACIAPP